MTTRTSSVEVAIRVRPMRTELEESKVAWELSRTTLQEIESETDLTFTFDRVYDPGVDTDTVYEKSVKDSIVRNVVQGYNGTVFAYGQTGSGKSHTMLGDKAGRGISSMALHDLFDGLNAEKSKGKTVRVFLEMLEIYNEQLRDLMLSRDHPQASLAIRENEHGVYVHNALRKEVKSAKECLDSMDEEAKNRVVASTKMNEQSSRSHCLIRIIVEKSEFFEADSSDSDDDGPSTMTAGGKKLEKKVVSYLNLVDLAGSERVAKTGATGQRMIEGGHINKSLTCLTTVIHKLSEPPPPKGKRGGQTYIPFRDSKLTHLLKTALGGNSYTTVFCCVTPATQHVDETRSTLYFAQRAKAIKNQVQTNEVMDSKTRIRDLEAQVKRMKRMLVACDIYVWAKELLVQKARAEASSGTVAEAAAAATEHVERLESLVQQLTQENETLKEEQQQAARYLGVPPGGAAGGAGQFAGGAAGGAPSGGYVDPMGFGFADSEEVARYKAQVAELEEDLALANEDRQALVHANQELEEICNEAGRDVEEKEDAISALRAQMRKLESEVHVLTSEVQSKQAQLEQAAEIRRQQEEALMEKARGDQLLERLTEANAKHQELQLEYDTLIDMYSKLEIESAADKEGLHADVSELEKKLAAQKEEGVEHNALMWKFVALAHLASTGAPMEAADIKPHQQVKGLRAEQTLKAIELFVASRASRGPAHADSSPSRQVTSAEAPASRQADGPSAGAPAASSSSGEGEEALRAKIKDLEGQLEISASRRDIIIDTKLKRMQELVLRLHTTNRRIMSEMSSVCQENEALHEIIRKESKLAKIARKEGLEPVNEQLIKNRAHFAPVPEAPYHHN